MKIEKNKHVLIIGGGFAGIRTALSLSKKSDFKGSITLVSNKNNFEYYPALYRMIIGYPSIQVSIPLSVIFKNTKVKIIIDNIKNIKKEENLVIGDSGYYHYDFLVLGLGSETNLFGITGLDQHVFPFKSVKEAFAIHDRLHEFFRTCHELSGKHIFLPEAKIVVIGGGPTGVEVSAELATHARKLSNRYQISEIPEIILIESNDKVLKNMRNKNLSLKVEERLEKLGIKLMLNNIVSGQDSHFVHIKGREEPITSKLVIWTAGVKNSSFYKNAGIFSFGENSKVLVDEYLRAVGHNNIFVIGDSADTPNTGTAQTAIFDGIFTANTITDFISEKKPKTYKPKTPIYVVPVGEFWGVLSWGNFWFYGFIPRFLRGLADLRFFLSLLPFSLAIKHFFARQ